MLVKVFGAIDVLAGLILIFGAGIKLPFFLLLFFGLVLIGKSFLGFLKNFASWIDFLSGLILILASIVNTSVVLSIISIIFGILVLQKGIASFL